GGGPPDRSPDRRPHPGAPARRAARPSTRARDRAVLASLWVVSFPCSEHCRGESPSPGRYEPTAPDGGGGENLGARLTGGVVAPNRRARMPFKRVLWLRRLAARNECHADTEPRPRSRDIAEAAL